MAASVKTPEAAVARIAFRASDVVISVQPSLGGASLYSPTLEELAASSNNKEIVVARQNADPLLSVYTPLRAGKLVSVTTTSSTLISSIPHLYKLINHPVVIHVSMQPSEYPDYSQITSIRQSGLTFLQSESTQEAQDIAIAAHALARKSGKAVVHFFSGEQQEVSAEDETLLERTLEAPAPPTEEASDSIYADDGKRATKHEIGDIPTSSSAISSGLVSPAPEAAQSGTASSAGSSTVDDKSSRPSLSSASSVQVPIVTRDVTSEDIYNYIEGIFKTIKESTGRSYSVFEYSGPSNAQLALFVFGSTAGLLRTTIEKNPSEYEKVGVVTARLYRPWFGTKLSSAIPSSVSKIAVLEQLHRQTTKWGPVFTDILTCFRANAGAQGAPSVVAHKLGYINADTVDQALRGVVQNLRSPSPVQNLAVGLETVPQKEPAPVQPGLEKAYFKILDQLFGNRLHVANSVDKPNAGVSTNVAASPEFGYGSLLARLERRKEFIQKVEKLAKSNEFTTQIPAQWLSRWLLVADDEAKSAAITEELLPRLYADGSPAAYSLIADKSLFPKESPWLIGSDAWAYDLGNSGVHHVIASGKNINMLIIDSQPYSEKSAADATRRKKDIGLYAMNFGNAYVASVAVYSSYTQVLHAMIEADKFDGPSVVLAYLPYNTEDESPLTVMQETKKAVDLGYWPLYRYDPYGEEKGGVNFQLESERIKQELKQFLDRENHLTQLIKRHPTLAANLSHSYGTEVRQQQKRTAKDAFNKLLEGLSGPPLTILFASDGGNAEGLAKKLERRGKARGLKTLALPMDEYPIEDLNNEENIVFITATAGQGEFPQNGLAFWQAVKDSTDLDLASVHFSVFGLGDSHYWPRKQDKIYYNKPAKDLYKRLADLGGNLLAEIGLGDDQDPDGYQTGYSAWEPQLWKALGVDKVDGLPDEPAPITNEDIKIESNFLRGTIAESLEDDSTGAISASDAQLTKFHGTYMQDDRDLREERKAQGLEPAYSFMIRCRLPGGVATPDQWIKMDDLANTYGNNTLKLTTRQTFQFHGIIKRNLKASMRAINRALMTTIAACGDVNRNVMCSSLPTQSTLHAEVQAIAQKVSDHLLPSTTAYHEIWLADDNDKKVQVAGNAVVDHEPLYGPTYLPRKFKITIAVPPHNDTDVYAHDIGLIAIKGEDGHLAGFNVLVGGGMGVTHNNKKTYPRTGSMFGFVPTADTHIVCEKIMLVQRDHGDRKNRKHARLKYTVDDMGVDVYREKVEELLGWKFQPARPFHFDSNVDTYGWLKDENGKNHFTLFIENGRVEDTPDFQMKTGLRHIAKVHKGEFRLTGNQHLILSNVDDADLQEMKDLLAKYKLDNLQFTGLRLSSSACVAFPTCGLAMAESERYLPKLIDKVETVLEESGLRHDSIVMRMTGCPNGCARPWLAEIAFVGKAYGAYNMYLGGGYHGQRLNKLFKSSIKEEEILEIVRGLFGRYAKEREEGERFGDFCIRVGVIKPTTEGKYFHEDVAEEDAEEEEE
ncbi:sulphite reductase hemo protein, beta subunit [Ascodesmis nigricans]|uniref:Sulfite reductase [NADPH] subunit beta n=1 Tax=Ascodesmis nigricans TaxID=341454 RepID=A0A4S2MWA5_9PEZI|nr:sulphite reductase hemo protein, beta subunit [Ascodesmis nigricans]